MSLLGLIHPFHLKPQHPAALLCSFMQLGWKGLKMAYGGSH